MVLIGEGGDDLGNEGCEGSVEGLSFLEDRRPREAGLKALKDEAFKDALLGGDCIPPLGVVVVAQEQVSRSPGRADKAVLAGDEAFGKSHGHLLTAAKFTPSAGARPIPASSRADP